KSEIIISSPWGMGILEQNGSTTRTILIKLNRTSFNSLYLSNPRCSSSLLMQGTLIEELIFPTRITWAIYTSQNHLIANSCWRCHQLLALPSTVGEATNCWRGHQLL